MKKKRLLKVYPRWYDYERNDAPHSEILLKGNWLTKAGFLPGDHVEVYIHKGWLHILKIKEKGGETNEARESSEEQRGQSSL